jgi:hypothetical protein
MLNERAIATAADYADSLLIARRAKNLLVLILLLCVAGQLALFFTAKYTDLVIPWIGGAPTTQAGEVAKAYGSASTMPSFIDQDVRRVDILHYVLGLTGYVGLVCSVILPAVLLVILVVMLVGRAVGVGPVTGALVWSLVLVALLFPWQAFLNNANLTYRDFLISGVLYTWPELLRAKFANDFSSLDASLMTILKWARFVLFPLVALILLLVVQSRSNRGLREALVGNREMAEL